MQAFALAFTELPEAPLSSFLQAISVPLNGSAALQCIHCYAQFDIVRTLAGGVLQPIIQAMNKMLNSTGPKADPRGTPLTTKHQFEFSSPIFHSSSPSLTNLALRLYGFSFSDT